MDGPGEAFFNLFLIEERFFMLEMQGDTIPGTAHPVKFSPFCVDTRRDVAPEAASALSLTSRSFAASANMSRTKMLAASPTSLGERWCRFASTSSVFFSTTGLGKADILNRLFVMIMRDTLYGFSCPCLNCTFTIGAAIYFRQTRLR